MTERPLKDLRAERCSLAQHALRKSRIDPDTLSVLVYELSAASEETLKWRKYVMQECQPIRNVMSEYERLLDAAKECRIEDCLAQLAEATLSKAQVKRAEVAIHSYYLLKLVEQDKLEEVIAQSGDQQREAYQLALGDVMRMLMLLNDPKAVEAALETSTRDLLAALAYWDREIVFERAKQLIPRAEKYRAEHTDDTPNMLGTYYVGVDEMSIIEMFLYGRKNEPFMDAYEQRDNRTLEDKRIDTFQFLLMEKNYLGAATHINTLSGLVLLPAVLRDALIKYGLDNATEAERGSLTALLVSQAHDLANEMEAQQVRSLCMTPAKLEELEEYRNEANKPREAGEADHMLWCSIKEYIKPKVCIYIFIGSILAQAKAMEIYEAPYFTKPDQFDWLKPLSNDQKDLPRKLDRKVKIGNPQDPHAKTEAWDLGFSPFGDMLAVSSSCGVVYIIDPYNGKTVFKLPAYAQNNKKYYPMNYPTKIAKNHGYEYDTNKSPDIKAKITEYIRRLRTTNEPPFYKQGLRRDIHSLRFHTDDKFDLKEGVIGDNYLNTDVVINSSGEKRVLIEEEWSDEDMSDDDDDDYDFNVALDMFAQPSSEAIMKYWADCLPYAPLQVQGIPAAQNFLQAHETHEWDHPALYDHLEELLEQIEDEELDAMLRTMSEFKKSDDNAPREARRAERAKRVNGMPTEEEVRQHYAKLEPPTPKGPSVSRGACCLAWAPEGDHLLVGSEEGRVAMWQFVFMKSELKYATCHNYQINDGKSHDTRVSAVCWLPMRQDGDLWWAAGDLAGNLTMRTVMTDQIWFMRNIRVLSLVVYASLPFEPKLLVLTALAPGQTRPLRSDAIYSINLPNFGFPDKKSLRQLNSVHAHHCSLTVSQGPYPCLVGNCSPADIMAFSPAEFHSRKTLTTRIVGPVQKTTIVKSCFGGPHQKYIASGSEDGVTRVYHRATNALVLGITHKDKDNKIYAVNAVDWAPDTCCLATACDDGYVRILRP